MTTEDEKISFISDLIKQKREITDDYLKYELRGNQILVGERERMEIMSALYESGFISVEQVKENIVYKLENKSRSKIVLNSDIEQQLFDEIRNAADKGISKWDLKQKTKLNPNVISKFIKSLENKNLIKNFKAKTKGKQLYFLADCVPDENEIGGNLYKEGEFDYDFLEELRKRIMAFVGKKKEVDYKDLLSFISSDSAGNLLNEKEIKLILNVMILDKCLSLTGLKFSTRRKQIENSAKIEKSVPCFKCPVFDICESEGTISPKNCIYFDNW